MKLPVTAPNPLRLDLVRFRSPEVTYTMHTTTILALSLVAPAFAVPQELEAPAPIASFDEIPWPLFDDTNDGPTWAIGKTWKMSFGDEGSTYFPRLGEKALRHTPLGFKVASATIGGEALELSAPGAPRVIGSTVEIDHGALVERWILGPDSAEQTFVVASLPRRGELIVTLDLETELVPVARGGGWCFEGPFGDVDYGTVTAIGGQGAEAAGSSRITANQLMLSVPAHFMEQAALPLTIDPVLSTGFVASTANHSYGHTDTTYSAALDRYVVVCEAFFNAGDNDVFALEVSGSGSLQAPAYYVIDATTDSWSIPACTYLESAGLLYVAASRFSIFVGSLGVRVINLPGGVTGAQRVHDEGWLSRPLSIDVGADRDTNVLGDVPNAVVVYTRSAHNSLTTVMRATTLSLPSSIQTLMTVTEPNSIQNVSISPHSARLNSQNQLQYIVAWNQRTNSSLPMDVGYASLESDSTTLIGSARVIMSGFDQGPPKVSDYGVFQGRSRAAITYTNDSPASSEDVVVAIIEDGVAPRISPLTFQESWNSNHKQWSPVVAGVGEHFGVAYLMSDPAQAGSRDHLYWASGGLAGGGGIGLAERRVQVSLNTLDAANPSLTLKDLAGASSPGEGLLTWTSRGTVYGARVAPMDIPVAGWQYCPSRPNSTGRPGWLRVIGRPSPSTSTLRLEAYNLPTGQFGMFFCSRGVGFVPFIGNSSGHLCLSANQFGRFIASLQQTSVHGRLVTVADPRALPQGMGTYAVQSGQTWCFQAWHRDVNHGGATSNLTNAVAVTFD